MRLARLAPLAAIALVVAACSSGSSATSSAASGSAAPSTEAVRIEVALTDALKMEPAAFTVPAGVPVTFVVTNSGTVLHEFVLGDETVQAEHEDEMKEAGGMTMAHDEPNAIGVDPGATKELTHTFEAPGTTYAGCHVVGHYAAGMKATITVE